MSEEEVWKPIKNYENLYEISNTGRVRSLSRKVFVTNRYGAKSTRMTKSKELKKKYVGIYYGFDLCKNGKKKSHTLHKLLAEVFIPNPNNYKYINHKDENKLNNSLDNLEWCTAKYNCNYGVRNEKISKTLKERFLRVKGEI